MPFRRSAGTPTTMPMKKHTTAAAGSVHPGVQMLSSMNGVQILPVTNMADTNAPIAKKPACPSESWPV